MANIYNFTDTWNAGLTTYSAIKCSVTDTASAADSALIDILVGGTSMFRVQKDGEISTSHYYSAIQKWAKGSDIASASALTIPTNGNFFDVTGTTAITSISAVQVGTRILLQFDGILTLTHHATDLKLPGGANITTAAGDFAEFVEYASGDWALINYTTAAAVYLGSLVEDTSPQLGGDLDANGNDIDMGTNLITDTKVGQWDTAYGWGNHASAGYLTSVNNGNWSGTDLAVTNGGTGASDEAGARTNLGVAIGSDVQAYSALLASVAALSIVSGDIVYGSGAGTMSRLAKGTDGQVLSLASGVPAWSDIPSSTPTLTAGTKPWSAISGDLSTTSSSYTKVSTVYAPGTGTIRAYFNLKKTGAGGTAYGRIYINGVAAGAEKSTSSTSYSTQSSDVSVTAGDTVELWLKNGGATSSDATAFYIAAAEIPPFGAPF